MSHVIVEKPDGTIAFGRNVDVAVPIIQEDENENENEYMVVIDRNDRINYRPIFKCLIHVCTIISFVKLYGSRRVIDLIVALLSFISSVCVHSNELITIQLLFLHSTYLIFYIPFISMMRLWMDAIFYTIHSFIILATLSSSRITHYS